jgi:ribose-phosphate pyrophosphokinase
MVNKRRVEANVAQVMNVIGDVRGRTCLVVDDIIDTAGTLVKTVDALLEGGATKVYATCTHPVLSGPAVERIMNSRLEQVVVTNTIPLHSEAKKCNKITVLSVGKLLSQAVQSIHDETSVSVLFI